MERQTFLVLMVLLVVYIIIFWDRRDMLKVLEELKEWDNKHATLLDICSSFSVKGSLFR